MKRGILIGWMKITLIAFVACSSSESEPEVSQPPAEQVTPPPPKETEQTELPTTSTGTPTSSGPISKPVDPASIVVRPEDDEKWVWIPIEGTRCADNTQAGIGVNFTKKSRELVFWFQGAGLCFDTVSCNGVRASLVGMGPDPLHHLWWGNPSVGQTGVFDRNDATNPFRAANFVVVPHCTVDAHAADKDSDYVGLPRVYQHGYVNVTHVLKRVVPTFADATRIVVAGFSAGGIGATVNYHQVASAFEAVDAPTPYLINDSGPILRKPFLSDMAQVTLKNGWALEKTAGAFCPECVSNMSGIYKANLTLHPGMRSAQISSYADYLVTDLYRLLNLDINLFDQTRLKNGLFDLDQWLAKESGVMAPSQHRSFYINGNSHHTIVEVPLGWQAGLAQFLNDQVTNSPTWSSKHQ